MRRLLFLVPVLGAAAVGAAVLALKPGASTAEAAKAAPRPDAPQLPVAQAVLFSSGVGYFQREG
ncbi:MAG TPA: hypothetical protein VFA26_24580, partial [Gemmataceae bacterium]|nr:hypothetical protein [Gemmataceae bacterium]